MTQALLYKKVNTQTVRCLVCMHHCCLKSNETGKCGVRQNINGRLITLNYGQAIALAVDPIEKKPLFHFLPGSQTFSFASPGCNFNCAFCQNYKISQATKNGQQITKNVQKIKPDHIVLQALKAHCLSIAYTYTEPTVFLEYALETMKLAHDAGLKNVWVSNGFMSPQTLNLILPYLDAINVDLKSFSDNFYQKICGARLQPVLDNLIMLKKTDIWLEITTLVIPGKNDNPKEISQLTKFIAERLGINIPWHVSRFYGQYQMSDLENTTINKIEQTIEIGHKNGLKFVYAGNIETENLENTYCPNCQQLLIKRKYYQLTRYDLNGQCPNCKKILPGLL